MADGLLILDSRFSRLKYLKQIIQLDKDYPTSSTSSSMWHNFNNATIKDAIWIVYLIDDVVVGKCLALPLKWVGPATLVQMKNSDEYWLRKTLYIYSISVDSDIYSRENIKKFNGVSVASQMNALMGRMAKDRGYDYIVGFAREGTSVNVAVKLGAKIIKERNNWGSFGATYYQIEYDLRKK